MAEFNKIQTADEIVTAILNGQRVVCGENAPAIDEFVKELIRLRAAIKRQRLTVLDCDRCRKPAVFKTGWGVPPAICESCVWEMGMNQMIETEDSADESR